MFCECKSHNNGSFLCSDDMTQTKAFYPLEKGEQQTTRSKIFQKVSVLFLLLGTESLTIIVQTSGDAFLQSES